MNHRLSLYDMKTFIQGSSVCVRSHQPVQREGGIHQSHGHPSNLCLQGKTQEPVFSRLGTVLSLEESSQCPGAAGGGVPGGQVDQEVDGGGGRHGHLDSGSYFVDLWIGNEIPSMDSSLKPTYVQKSRKVFNFNLFL